MLGQRFITQHQSNSKIPSDNGIYARFRQLTETNTAFNRFESTILHSLE